MRDIAPLLAAYEVELLGTEYDRHACTMQAHLRLTMRGKTFDEAVHDRLQDEYGDLSDEHWRIEALDKDGDDDWATAIMLVKAVGNDACRMLHGHVAAVCHWFLATDGGVR